MRLELSAAKLLRVRDRADHGRREPARRLNQMCGIVGYCSFDQRPPERAVLERMIQTLRHRGPDASAIHIEGAVGLAHARLSIIDPEGGRQPLFNEDGSVVVVVNGEIYNFRQLRSELTARGHRFRTGSDCEVIVHLWEERRERLVDDLRGMFAFVLYDRSTGTVFGARDRFGQKPLFYHVGSRGFSFASEIKGLLPVPGFSRELDTVALDQFLFHQYVPQPRTLFADVKRLPAGYSFSLEGIGVQDGHSAVDGRPPRANVGQIELQRYWKPTFAPDPTLPDEEHLGRLETALVDAIESHLVADVPVGVFLSGGIDSSLITAVAARSTPEPLQTYSISFPNSPHDEAQYARAVSVALGTRHREFPFQPDDYSRLLTEAAALFDQPLADASVLPLMALSRAAADEVKVVLTGDGGDELFAGYRKYRRMASAPGNVGWLSRWSEQLFPAAILARCAPDPFGWGKCRSRLAGAIAPATRSLHQRQGWEGWERFALYRPEVAERVGSRFESLSELFGPAAGGIDPLNAALCADQGTALADGLLLKADYSTMAFGLEARAPLLDHLLADVAGRLPLHLKVTSRTTKVALRTIARRWLPPDIVDRRKKGFSMPRDQWFRHELRDWTRRCLIDESLSVPRYFERRAVEQLLEQHQSGRKNHAARIHILLTFELWMREYLGSPAPV